MQIVIDIDEKLYNYIQTEGYDEHLDKRFDYQIRFAVKDGTPLTKGYGRLIDEKVLLRKLRSRNFGFNLPTWVKVAIDNTPAIIEADKENKT